MKKTLFLFLIGLVGLYFISNGSNTSVNFKKDIFIDTFINKQTMGSATTLSTAKGGIRGDSALILPFQFLADTTAANFTRAAGYMGSLIRIGNTMWIRGSSLGNNTPNRWYEFAVTSSTGTVTSISQGFGIVNTPNPITTTGTVTVDTLAISTKANVQKVKDSVIGVLGNYVQLQQSPQVAQTGGLRVTDTIRTDGYVYGQNLYAVSANAIPGVTGINSSTGRGGSFSSQSGIGLAVQNSSTTNPAFKAIQNSTASIAQFYNNFDLGVMIDTSADITINNLRSSGLYTGKIKLPTISANREYTLPNNTGVLALQGDTTGFGTKFIYNQTGSNLSAQTAKFKINDTGWAAISIGDSVIGTTGMRGAGGLFTARLTLGANATNDSAVYLMQTMAGNDYLRIFGTGTVSDRGEAVFKVGDNGLPYASGGQRFRFSYDTVGGSGSPKDVFIIDYNTITTPNSISAINGDLIGSSDTAAMLVPYLRKSDTASMLSGYAKSGQFIPYTGATSNININTRTITAGGGNFFLDTDGTIYGLAVDIAQDLSNGYAARFNNDNANGKGVTINAGTGQQDALTIRDYLQSDTLLRVKGNGTLMVGDPSSNNDSLIVNGVLTAGGATLTGALSGTSAGFTGSVNMATTSGSVGIGTVSPRTLLDVNGGVALTKTYTGNNAYNGSRSAVVLDGATTRGSFQVIDGQSVVLVSESNVPLLFGANNLETFRTIPGGRTLFNTTTDDGSSVGQFNGNVLMQGVRYAYTAQTTTYAIQSTDYMVDCTSGTFTTTLPTAASVAGKVYVIKNSGAGTITIATTSSQTIDGSTTKTLNTQYTGYQLISDGSNWKIISTF